MENQHLKSAACHPLSLNQQNIWDAERACPSTSINHICTTLRIQGRVNIALLQRSVDFVLSSDPSLRTQITLQGQTPVQYHAVFTPEAIPVFDFTQAEPDGIERWETAFAREPMPLFDAPLYRFAILHTGETTGCLVIKFHHLISDGWSQVLFCNRVGQCYLDFLAGRTPDLGEIPIYLSHVEEEARYLSSSSYSRDEAYWSDMLERSGEASSLKSARGAAMSFVGNRLTFSLPQDLNHDIYSFCMHHRVAPFSVFYLALAIYFRRIGGSNRFTIGVPIFNRKNFTEKQTSGMFVSTLPFFCEVADDWSLNDFCNHMNEEWFEMLRHQRFPFSHIQKLAGQICNQSNRLFQIAFSYQNGQLLESPDATVSFSGRWHYSGYQLEQLCIHLSNLQDIKQYSVDYDYLTQLFSTREIETLHTCIVNILRNALAAPDCPISQIPLLSPEERERVLYTFNRTSHPIFETGLYHRFTGLVEKYPKRAALIYDGQRMTYEQLESEAARIHASLSGICAAQDALVAVLLPRCPSLFSSMVGILRAGGAFLLLSPEYPESRIRDILSQSNAAILLSTSELGNCYSDLLPVIDVDFLPSPTLRAPAEYRPEGLAYVVYTSGSTGMPKGVEIKSGSLLNLCCAMESIYSKGAVLSVCSIGFDAFLLESICALLNGRTILLPRDEELESPRALADLIKNYDVGFLSTTPSRLSAYLKSEEFRKAMDGMESIVCGGEAFPSDLLSKLRLDTSARIYNQYGPSETTVAVSLKQLNEAQAITVGRPMQNCRLYVLDKCGNPLPVGVYGDLHIGGLCVGRGYRNAPALTEQAFFDDPFEFGGRLYHTGDLARWTPDGEIVLAGRSDQQVKLRGLRIEPQEIAACLSRHPQVLQAAAAVQDHCGQSVLLGFYVSDEPIPEDELLSLCSSHLPHYMVPTAILRMDAIPLTANGKVDAARLPHPDLASSSSHAPASLLQDDLLTVFRRVLGHPDLDVSSDFFLSGGNSLNAMEALSEIRERTGHTLRISDLYTYRNVLRLSAHLENCEDALLSEIPRLKAAPALDRWPLTPIQQGIYVQSHLDPTGKTYHMAGAFRLSFVPDIPRLERAFRMLIAQEPLLRTSFVPDADGIFARVQSEVDFALPVFQGNTLSDAASTILAPFCLDRAPLLRAGLWEESEGQWILLLNLHHIIGDGLTTPILLQRLDMLYRGLPAATNTLSYLDYAWHLSQQKDTSDADDWREHLSPLPESLELPGDFARSHDFDFKGGKVSFALSRELSARCDAYCTEKGISPYMFFLGAFALLLSRLSGKEDFLIGSAAAGRTFPETQSMCGPFINTLPLRLQPVHDLSLDDYLNAVRAEVNHMLDHQQTGLETIVSSLGIKRSLSQSPLYQVIFSQRPLDAESFTLDGHPMEYIPLATETARMDLWVELSKEQNCYTFHTEYASQLFLPETVSYFCRCLETISASMLSPETKCLSQIEALSVRDRMELIDVPNNTVYPFLNLPIPVQFDRHLALDPDAPAVIFHGQTTTRRELDRRACQIANLLTEAGAVPGTRIGIALSRNVDLVAAVLAIWKIGGSYAPLLAHYPEQRLAYMVEIAGISHILCDEKTSAQLPATLPCKQVPLSQNASDTFCATPLKETDLAEVLFTSGSTGQPKGVMLNWRSIANMAGGFREILERSEGPVLCTTNVVFDMFNGEVVIPLSMGKTIVMADEEEMMLPWKLAEIIERDGVKITQSTPSRVQMWFTNEAFCRASSNLDLMIYGGEVLTETLIRQAQTASNEAIQVNMYGPTEGTVYNTTRQVDYRSHINVGWPMRNNRVYVLDEKLQPVLPSAVGDLYLAGECVTQGYISRTDLTEAAYLPDPFFPGERMYRTGDVGRLRLDGSYDFLGRRDAQVKLNGQRVELDEINGAFVSENCALQAATVPVRRDDGSMELFTYYVPVSPALADQEIRSRLGKILPAYMIPSHMQAMDTLPSTPTGKINLRALKEMAESGEVPASVPAPVVSNSPEPAAPESVCDSNAVPGSLDWILTLWARILNRADVSPTLSFFEQGGTSLAALSVLSHYNNSGLTMTLEQFYRLSTAAEQSGLFAPAEVTSPERECSPESIPAIPDSPYPRFVPELHSPCRKRAMKTVLLTGATGFLGVHILRALLDAGVTKIICTMRSGSRERLLDTLTSYFGIGRTAGIGKYVEVLQADISKPLLGLSSEEYQALSQQVHAIWHCAADVRHYASNTAEVMQTNLEGTRTLLNLAQMANIPFYHMSTTSVSGDRLLTSDASAVFTEQDFCIGQDWEKNLYVRSKFLAEDAVLEAIKNGANARIFRIGRLVGRCSDGTFQKNPETNAFWLTLRGIHALGAIPTSMANIPLELTPVDWCARAAVALRNAPLSVYHLQSSTPPTAEQVARAIVPDLALLSDREFEARLNQAPIDLSGSTISPLLDLWHQLQSAPQRITVDSSLTEEHLRETGFNEIIPGPNRLLRAFRFPENERMKG